MVSLIDLLTDAMVGAAPPAAADHDRTRKARIFERHARWHEVARSIVRPSAEDQEILHALIYRLKRGERDEAGLDWLASLLARYQAAGCIFGCTELHLVHRGMAAGSGEDPGSPHARRS